VVPVQCTCREVIDRGRGERPPGGRGRALASWRAGEVVELLDKAGEAGAVQEWSAEAQV
jgi:hypothetical protein